MPPPHARPLAARPLWLNAGWSLAGEGVHALGQFATLVILARLGSAQVLGQYTLGLAIATPMILLTNLHLRPAYVIDHGRWRYDQYLTLRMLTVPLALLLTIAVALLGGYGGRTVLMVAAVGGFRGWEALSDMLLGPAQKAEQMAAVGRSRALRGLLTATGLGLGLGLTGDALVGMALALALLGALTLVHDAPVARRFATLRPAAPRRELLALARHTLPIGLAAFILSASVSAPAFVLEHTHDVTTLGYFAAATSLMYVGNVLNVAMGTAATPRLARLYRTGRRPLLRLLAVLLVVVGGLGGAVVLAAALGGALYLGLAYGPAYLHYAPELVLATGAAGVAGLANMLSQTFTAMGRFATQLRINLISLAASVLLASWLIPGGGLRGATWALLALAGVRLCIYAVVILRKSDRSSHV